jgi:peptidoglycan-associated lipoprotein
MFASRRSIAAIALTLFVATACKKKPEVAPAPAPPPPAPAAPAPRVNQDSIDAARRAADAAARAAAADADARRRAAEMESVRSALAAKVYFDYDKDEIRDDARATLDTKVAILNANTAVRLRIAGHTDDRGSDEYNLALGQRRAASVQRYLVAHGVAASRFETVSFGKERPVAQGENEGAWSQNRRGEFEIIAGGDMLRMPK